MRNRRFSALVVVALLVIGATGSVAQQASAPPALPGSLGQGVTLLPNGWKIPRRTSSSGRRPAAGDARIARRPLPARLEQRLREADRRRRRPEARLRRRRRGTRSRLARPGLAPRRPAVLRVGRRQYDGARDAVRERPGDAGGRPRPRPPDGRAGLDAESLRQRAAELHRRRRGQSGRETTLCGPRARQGGVAGRSRRPATSRARSSCRPSRTRVSCHPTGRRCSCRCGAARRSCCSTRPPSTRWARCRSASTRTRWRSRRTARGCSSPAPTRTPSGWWTSRSGRRPSRCACRMFPDAPPGSTPNAVSVSPDGRRLLVANADNNTVAVVDISDPARSEVQGFIPTGWYPTGAMFSRDGSRIFVLSGKGLDVGGQPAIQGARPARRRPDSTSARCSPARCRSCRRRRPRRWRR